MVENVKSLNLKRAEEQEDCRLCSALEVLEELVEDIKSGEEPTPDIVFVAMKHHAEDNPNLVGYNHRCAGGVKTELTGLLAIHLGKLVDSA